MKTNKYSCAFCKRTLSDKCSQDDPKEAHIYVKGSFWLAYEETLPVGMTRWTTGNLHDIGFNGTEQICLSCMINACLYAAETHNVSLQGVDCVMLTRLCGVEIRKK